MSMYSKLKYHPNTLVSKKAKMFMFSFQVKLLKCVHNVSLAPFRQGFEHESLGVV
jgi:hypothetical protein